MSYFRYNDSYLLELQLESGTMDRVVLSSFMFYGKLHRPVQGLVVISSIQAEVGRTTCPVDCLVKLPVEITEQ